MCILFIALNQHPKYPLIITANRDEFIHRPTQALHWWQEPAIYAGKDLEAGGTWMGVNSSGDIAALTNLRRPDLTQSDVHSRGELVPWFLSAAEDKAGFVKALKHSKHHYNPYNLLFGNAQQLQVFNSISGEFSTLSDGFHSISNGAMDDVWPKMARGIQALELYITSHTILTWDDLFTLMRDDQQAAVEQLPDTGIEPAYEQQLSSIFIPPFTLVKGRYATRSSAVFLQQGERWEMQERVYH